MMVIFYDVKEESTTKQQYNSFWDCCSIESIVKFSTIYHLSLYAQYFKATPTRLSIQIKSKMPDL